jgi:hypothetical protein
MKNSNKQFVLILVLLSFFSCKSHQNTLYEFNPSTLVENKIKLSEIADEITYIPLDNSFQLGLIYNYRIVKNSIYLSAKDIGILKLSREGKNLRKIGNIGRGPGEYTYCFDFTVDENKETVYVMDQADLKVYSKTGDFLRTVSLKDYGDNIASFEINDSKIIVYFMLQYGNPKYDWIALDTLGNLITGKKRTTPEFTTNWLLQGGTYKFDNKVTYWNPFTDTAFSVSPDLTYKESFIISPGEYRFPKFKFYSFEQFRQYLNIGQIFETNRYLVLRYNYKKPTIALIDKKTRKSNLSFLEVKNENNPRPDYIGGILNDIDGGVMFQPGGASGRQESYFVENDREYIIGLTESYKIKTRVEGNEFKNSLPEYPEKKKALKKLANTLKETDNPVLMIVRLKK